MSSNDNPLLSCFAFRKKRSALLKSDLVSTIFAIPLLFFLLMKVFRKPILCSFGRSSSTKCSPLLSLLLFSIVLNGNEMLPILNESNESNEKNNKTIFFIDFY